VNRAPAAPARNGQAKGSGGQTSSVDALAMDALTPPASEPRCSVTTEVCPCRGPSRHYRHLLLPHEGLSVPEIVRGRVPMRAVATCRQPYHPVVSMPGRGAESLSPRPRWPLHFPASLELPCIGNGSLCVILSTLRPPVDPAGQEPLPLRGRRHPAGGGRAV